MAKRKVKIETSKIVYALRHTKRCCEYLGRLRYPGGHINHVYKCKNEAYFALLQADLRLSIERTPPWRFSRESLYNNIRLYETSTSPQGKGLLLFNNTLFDMIQNN